MWHRVLILIYYLTFSSLLLATLGKTTSKSLVEIMKFLSDKTKDKPFFLKKHTGTFVIFKIKFKKLG